MCRCVGICVHVWDLKEPVASQGCVFHVIYFHALFCVKPCHNPTGVGSGKDHFFHMEH